MVNLLVNHLLGPLLLVRQIITQPAQRLLRNHQPRSNHSLTTSHIPIPTTLLVLRAIGIKDVFARITGKTEREESSINNSVFDLSGLFLDDGESFVDFG
jgi:hypothetical protein